MRPLVTILLTAIFAATAAAQTQAPNSPKPYATLDRQAVTYRGPVSTGEELVSADSAVIGIILPLTGPQKTEGEALLAAAQLAIEEEQSRGPLPDGRQLRLAVRDESGPWGQASMEILKLIDQDHALAIVTSANGTSAHLAEQMAIKIGIPILTLASDPTTTEANVPWIFRVGPSDTDQARAFCREIYSRAADSKNVLLVAQSEHDGRTGAEAFEKAAKEFTSDLPTRLEVDGVSQSLEPLRAQFQSSPPDAVVIWTDAPEANTILAALHSLRPDIPVFLATKAAQLAANTDTSSPRSFTVDSANAKSPPATGLHSCAARLVYEAVRTVADALRVTGANRVLLRDYLSNQLANAQNAHASFDAAGNSLQPFTVVALSPGINP